MANLGIEEIFDYCFTTMGTIYSMECVFVIQYIVYAENVKNNVPLSPRIFLKSFDTLC